MDLNLAFPGNEQGEVTEQIADSVCRHTKDSQFGVIIQSADLNYNDAPHLFCLNPDSLAKDFAKSLGVQNAREPINSPTFKLSLHSHWIDEMITSVVLSAGKANHLDITLCENILPGLINSLLWAGALGNDQKKRIKYRVRFNKQNKETFVSSHAGGFFLPKVTLGSEIKKGQRIGAIFDIHSNATLESIIANSSGYLVTLRNHPIVYQKEVLAVLLGKSKFRFWS